MKTKNYGFFNYGNGFLTSFKISLEKLKQLCESTNCPYFKVHIKYEKNYEENPEFKFWISTDIIKKESNDN